MNDTQRLKFPKSLAFFCCVVVRRMMLGRNLSSSECLASAYTHPDLLQTLQ